MASLVLKMSVSLDGYVAPADGSSDWVAAGRSDDGARWTLETGSNAGTHLIGAATYTRWAGFWPGAAGPFAQPVNEIPKVVFSDSLTSADWGPTTIARQRLDEDLAHAALEQLLLHLDGHNRQIDALDRDLEQIARSERWAPIVQILTGFMGIATRTGSG
jgi:RibD C-terminal domain